MSWPLDDASTQNNVILSYYNLLSHIRFFFFFFFISIMHFLILKFLPNFFFFIFLYSLSSYITLCLGEGNGWKKEWNEINFVNNIISFLR
jgi:hypothetical protein